MRLHRLLTHGMAASERELAVPCFGGQLNRMYYPSMRGKNEVECRLALFERPVRPATSNHLAV
jgi:hypothetical protein